jgi:hypothetical protein
MARYLLELRGSLGEAEKHNIISKYNIIRMAPEEIARGEEEEIRKALRKAREILSKIPSEEIVKVIRKDRRER